MDIYELLEKDHEKVDGLFEQILDTDEEAVTRREQLLRSLKEELEMHARLEEQLLYPRLEAFERTRQLAREAYQEHEEMRLLMSECESESPESSVWLERCTELQALTEEHVEKEEDELFMAARDVLGDDEARALASEAQALRSKEAGARGQ